MKRADLYPGPDLPRVTHLLAEEEGIENRFTRWFVHRFDRMHWKWDAQRVFCCLVLATNNQNIAYTSVWKIHKALKMPVRSVYNNLAVLRREGAIIPMEINYWMVDPDLVYSGPSKYHRRARTQFRLLSDQQPKDNHAENHERNDDEQCDLQARSGDPDPAHDAARAECT